MMNKSKAAIYLPIRSLGDFIISASVVQDKFTEPIPIILPEYLTDLFVTIKGETHFKVLDSVQFDNQPVFFELYTLKAKLFQTFSRLVNDIGIAKRVLIGNKKFLLDYSSKRLLFTKADLVWPDKKKNIYEAKSDMFTESFKHLLNAKSQQKDSISTSKISKILIVPDSRIITKSIQDNVIDVIIKHFNDYDIKIACFSKFEKVDTQRHYYSNFNELIKLINEYDLIVSAESLPYHLANYLRKQHFVIYNKSRHFKTTFMTPFMVETNSYSVFEGDNYESVINDLNKILRKNLN